MDITIKYQSSGKWHTVDVNDLLPMSVSHMIDLFSGKIPVICKCEGGGYIVNTPALADSYRKKGEKVKLFSELGRSEGRLSVVGLQ